MNGRIPINKLKLIQTEALKARRKEQISELAEERKKLRLEQKRWERKGSQVYANLWRIAAQEKTDKMRELYKDVRMCVEIITDSPQVRLNAIRLVQQRTYEEQKRRFNAEHKGDNSIPTLRDLKTLYREFNISGSIVSSRMSSSLDGYFEAACNEYPDSITAISWTAFSNNQANVAKDINSTLYASIQKLFVDEVIRLSEDYEPFDFRRLGREKIALFVVTSPTTRFIDDYINTMYRFAIAELMDEAQKYPDARLPVPVHMIFDDFACGTQIKNFDSYISVFRQAGISAMLLLQSESQLFATYGESKATTIIDNCDTYVYLGCNDVRSAERVAKRLNKPLNKVMELPLGSVVVMRRGAAPVVTTRYRTYEDPNYIKYAERRQEDVIR